jgi:predicted ArsR family transcriptional regulator
MTEHQMTEHEIEASAPESVKPRPGKTAVKTKSDNLCTLLSRRNGATVAQIQKQLGWQPHTIRAAISRLRSSGLSIDLDRSGRQPRYRAVSAQDQ